MIWLVQLVFDSHDPDAITKFWGRALEYRSPAARASDEETRIFRKQYPQFEGRGRIDDQELRRMPVYIQRVPEPKERRNRVRLEIAVPDGEAEAAVNELRGFGARAGAFEGEFIDVEGNEFTVVPSTDARERRLQSIVIDCVHPERVLRFWSSATGYSAAPGRCDPVPVGAEWDGSGFVVAGGRFGHITGADAKPGPAPFDLVPAFAFVETSTPKEVKNRVHVDLSSTDVLADRERLVALGATVLRWDTDHVLADPEGNEFCLGGRPA